MCEYNAILGEVVGIRSMHLNFICYVTYNIVGKQKLFKNGAPRSNQDLYFWGAYCC